MYKPLILPLAKRDIKEAYRWYENRQTGLGKRFTFHARETVAYIRQNPEAVTLRYDESRTALIGTFPYMIHLTIDKSRELIIIAAVLSTSRNPKMWKERE